MSVLYSIGSSYTQYLWSTEWKLAIFALYFIVSLFPPVTKEWVAKASAFYDELSCSYSARQLWNSSKFDLYSNYLHKLQALKIIDHNSKLKQATKMQIGSIYLLTNSLRHSSFLVVLHVDKKHSLETMSNFISTTSQISDHKSWIFVV